MSGEQVNAERGITLFRKTACNLPDIIIQAVGLMYDDDTRERAFSIGVSESACQLWYGCAWKGNSVTVKHHPESSCTKEGGSSYRPILAVSGCFTHFRR
ncbi:MAG TPA: hypothetical protein VMT24_11330 [Aggregatilineaceae bacterium]|nr:hypothetical protein [Aggregatilineaceae bacterium]